MGPANTSAARRIFDRLLHRAPDGSPQPWLAESWHPIGDAGWEFRLRPGARWHDGREVTADDVAFPSVRGMGVWEYRAAHPEEGAIFDAAMTALSRDVAAGVAAAHGFAPFSRVVDVDGGRGALLGSILAANPALRGVLFDQPGVVAQARPELERLGVAERCEIVRGSFFERVPASDLLLLKAVLHDWDDARTVAILAACRRALAPGGKVLLLERVLAGPNEGPEAKFADLNMLVGPGGRERTEGEFAALLASAGLRLARVLPTRTRLAVIEGVCG